MFSHKENELHGIDFVDLEYRSIYHCWMVINVLRIPTCRRIYRLSRRRWLFVFLFHFIHSYNLCNTCSLCHETDFIIFQSTYNDDIAYLFVLTDFFICTHLFVFSTVLWTIIMACLLIVKWLYTFHVQYLTTYGYGWIKDKLSVL